jgi:uncharacterized membrane protein YoaK (UPF0700 family)
MRQKHWPAISFMTLVFLVECMVVQSRNAKARDILAQSFLYGVAILPLCTSKYRATADASFNPFTGPFVSCKSKDSSSP